MPVAMVSAEPLDRGDAVNSVARAAAFLRKREPQSPAPYLMMRGLRWGELRAAAKLGDATLLEAPPTELRQQLKRLALTQKWSELLDLGENSMALPCSRAWLDLQRLVVEALTGLGNEYAPIAVAIRSELRALLTDLPELLDASLLDDTAAANPETRAWLKQLLQGQPQERRVPGNRRKSAAPATVNRPHPPGRQRLATVIPQPRKRLSQETLKELSRSCGLKLQASAPAEGDSSAHFNWCNCVSALVKTRLRSLYSMI